MKVKYIVIVVLILVSASAFTWATKGKFLKPEVAVKKVALITEPTTEDIAYDPALLKKFREVSDNLDAGKPECLIVGVINSFNHADSSDVIRDLNYIYSKKGQDFYYKLGNTETINAHNTCIYIDHDSRQVIVSPYRSASKVGFANMEQLLKGLESENYELTSTINGNQETIAMINEDHVSMKEYRVSFDTLTLKATRVYTRYANPENPEGTNNEKTMEIGLSVLQNKSGIEKYIAKPVVTKNGAHLALEKSFEGYELIQM